MLREILDGLQDIAYKVNLETRAVDYVSPSVETVFGYSPRKVVGFGVNGVVARVHPDDRENAKGKLAAFLEEFPPESARQPWDLRFMHKNGHYVWLSVSHRLVRDGRTAALIGTARDVTLRKQAEESLRQSEARYRDLAESIADVFFAMDRDLKYTYWNKASEALTGIPAENALGKSLYDLFPGIEGSKAEQAYLEVLRTGQPQQLVSIYSIRGEDRCFEISACPSSEGLTVFARDVTQLKRAQEALRESERRYRLISENAGDMIGLHRLPDLVWIYANPATVAALGYSADELVGKSVSEFLHPDDVEAARLALQQGLAEGAASAQVRCRKKDGSYIWLEAKGGKVTDETGEEVILIVSRDITSQKNAEERLSQRAEHLMRQLEERYDMVGESPAMQALYDFIRKVAPTEAGVLICGESGTGKEMVARAIHRHSDRREGPLEIVNCAAMPATLLESELFGHVRGAFTGAVSDKMGRFELAHGGTLFLDEVVELPLECQTKLLRVLEEKRVRRVGDTRDRMTDVRLIAATNRNVTRAVAEGRLRADIFYRLDRLRVEVPPLREREGDLELLAQHFLEQLSFSCKRDIEGFAPQVLEVFRSYKWPGNVRELKNVVERMVLLGEGKELRLEDVPADLRGSAEGRIESLSDMERRHILRVLEEVGGNKKRAAQLLGIDRSTLYAKLRSYGMRP
jgi:two-component system response regulator HydG